MRGPLINGLAATPYLGWILLFGLGLLLDLLFGGKSLLGKLPHVDDLLGGVCTPVERRLNRLNRSAATLRMRAIIVQIVLLPLMCLLGGTLNKLGDIAYVGAPLSALVLARSIGIRSCWDELKAVAQQEGAKPHVIRGAAETLAMVHVRDWVCNLLLFAVGGFSLLLPFRFLATTLGEREASGAARPESVFHRTFVPLFDLLALPGAITASLIFSLAPVLVPGTNLSAVRGLISSSLPAFRGILSRFIPLSTVAYALNFSFAFDRKGSGGGWIGPEAGRAQLVAGDLRTTTLYILAAGSLTLLAMLMASAGLLLVQTGKL
ncbi:hypothetical protein [Kordiimonas aestuarii]|uniref:hypothetical protein n=1 Tax=Kordiimonas aestuarii TaxID=1005925 RepID=UPI0021D1A680|nr:hypothetical protein [Kordiimonas aestuarii]